MDIEAYQGTEEEIKSLYDNGEIYVYVTKEENNYTIHSSSSEESMYAVTFMESFFDTYKNILQENYLTKEGINASEVLNIINVTEEQEEEDFYFASYMQNYAFLFVVMAITVSATYPSTDTTAGEKERGTLETLLTFPIKSKDIILGKYLSVTLSSIITGVLSFILAIVTLMITKNKWSPIVGGCMPILKKVGVNLKPRISSSNVWKN